VRSSCSEEKGSKCCSKVKRGKHCIEEGLNTVMKNIAVGTKHCACGKTLNCNDTKFIKTNFA
jgi:hypothetical protein